MPHLLITLITIHYACKLVIYFISLKNRSQTRYKSKRYRPFNLFLSDILSEIKLIRSMAEGEARGGGRGNRGGRGRDISSRGARPRTRTAEETAYSNRDFTDSCTEKLQNVGTGFESQRLTDRRLNAQRYLRSTEDIDTKNLSKEEKRELSPEFDVSPIKKERSKNQKWPEEWEQWP